MPLVPLESVVEGDVVKKDVIVGDVVLFGAGTVIANKFIDILKMLGVREINVENREGEKFRNLKEAYENIDSRFSYVDDKPHMTALKYMAKDVLANARGYR